MCTVHIVPRPLFRQRAHKNLDRQKKAFRYFGGLLPLRFMIAIWQRDVTLKVHGWLSAAKNKRWIVELRCTKKSVNHQVSMYVDVEIGLRLNWSVDDVVTSCSSTMRSSLLLLLLMWHMRRHADIFGLTLRNRRCFNVIKTKSDTERDKQRQNVSGKRETRRDKLRQTQWEKRRDRDKERRRQRGTRRDTDCLFVWVI